MEANSLAGIVGIAFDREASQESQGHENEMVLLHFHKVISVTIIHQVDLFKLCCHHIIFIIHKNYLNSC